MFFDRINEGDTSTIRCPENSAINVTSASFYKLKPDLWFGSSTTSDNYDSSNQYCDNSFDTVRRMCDGQQSCSIYATEYTLGYPCVGVTKNYLNVSYACSGGRNGNDFFLKHPRITSFSLPLKVASIIKTTRFIANEKKKKKKEEEEEEEKSIQKG